MTVQEFVNKWNGKKIDYDGIYDNQCTDLTKQWLSEIGYEVSGAWGNAKDWDKNASRPDFQWIANTPTGVPNAGDLVVWGNGTYGHIALFIEGDVNSFRSFDQNYPSGKGEPCTVINHNYTNVKGWLRPLKYNNAPPADPKDVLIADLQRRIVELENRPPVQVPYEVDRPETLKELENARAGLVEANKTISGLKVELKNCIKTKKDLFDELDLIISNNYLIKRNFISNIITSIKGWFERKK